MNQLTIEMSVPRSNLVTSHFVNPRPFFECLFFDLVMMNLSFHFLLAFAHRTSESSESSLALVEFDSNSESESVLLRLELGLDWLLLSCFSVCFFFEESRSGLDDFRSLCR